MAGHEPHSLEYFSVYVSSKDAFIHYTCNAPSKKTLEKNGILTRGEEFGCANEKEMLEIPGRLYFKKGFKEKADHNSIKINLEKLLRDIV